MKFMSPVFIKIIRVFFNVNDNMWVSQSAIKESFWAQICIIVITFFEAFGGLRPPNPQYNIA